MRVFKFLFVFVFICSYKNCAYFESSSRLAVPIENEALRVVLEQAIDLMEKAEYKEAFKRYLILTDPSASFLESDFRAGMGYFRIHAKYFLSVRTERSYAHLIIWHIADFCSAKPQVCDQNAFSTLSAQSALKYGGHAENLGFFNAHENAVGLDDFVLQLVEYYGSALFERIALSYPRVLARHYKLKRMLKNPHPSKDKVISRKASSFRPRASLWQLFECE